MKDICKMPRFFIKASPYINLDYNTGHKMSFKNNIGITI